MPGAGGPPPALVTPQDVAIGKPHSQCCELAARKFDVKVNERLVFEDAAGRTLAARGVSARVAPALDVGHSDTPPAAQRGATVLVARSDNMSVFDRGRGAVITTSGKSLDATAELSKGVSLPDSNGESRSVHPASTAASVAMKTIKIPVRSFARRMTHYLLAPGVLYEWRCGAKFCSDTIVHTTLIFHCRDARNRRAAGVVTGISFAMAGTVRRNITLMMAA